MLGGLEGLIEKIVFEVCELFGHGAELSMLGIIAEEGVISRAVVDI